MNKILIGFDCVGTGTSLTTMDELADYGYFPVNFADTSGNPTGSKIYRITKIILSQAGIQGYLFVSCISSQQLDNTARGIIKALKEIYHDSNGKPDIPMVFCFRGGWDDVAIQLFRDHGISTSPWVRLLGRDSTELEAVEMFDAIHKEWRKALYSLPSRILEFETMRGRISVDLLRCAECSSKACVSACPAQIYCLKDGYPAIAMDPQKIKKGGCTETCACELECHFKGNRGLKIVYSMPGLESTCRHAD